MSQNAWRAFELIPLRFRASVLFGFVVASLFEFFGLAIVVPLFAMVGTGVQRGGFKGAIRDLVDSALRFVGLELNFLNLLLLVIVFLCMKAAITILVMRHVGDLMARVTTEVRLRIIRGFLDARWAYFAKKRMARMVQAIGSGANAVGESFLTLATLAGSLFQCLVYFSICLVISPPMAGVAGFVAIFMIASYGRLVRRTKSEAKHQAKQMRRMSNGFTDALLGMKAIKAMGRQAQFAKLFAKDSWTLHKMTRSRVVSSEFADELQEPIIAISLGVGLYVGNVVLKMDVGHQFIIVLVLIRLIGSFRDLQRGYHRMSRTREKYRAATGLLNEIETIREDIGGDETPDASLGVEFREVSFAYGQNKQILRHANFKIDGGMVTLFFGPSGAGKSTILDLVLGLVKPKYGEAILGGSPLGRVNLVKWRRQIGYVPQETFLFHDSILNNITLGESGHTREDVWRALRDASADSFVAALPNGLDQDVGERGLKLSGGQRQRIALARALLHRPKMLILDEATAALDVETEREICNRVREMSAVSGLTVLCVSHSEQWKRAADNVIEVEPLANAAEPMFPRSLASSSA